MSAQTRRASLINYSGFAVGLAILLAVCAYSIHSHLRSYQEFKWVAHTHVVLSRIPAFLSAIHRAESEQRGFLLTSETRFLDSFHAAATEVDRHLAQLSELTVDNPTQSRFVEKLFTLANKRMDLMEKALNQNRDVNINAALDIVQSAQPRQIMADLYRLVSEMSAEEERLLQLRDGDAYQSARNTTLLLIVGFLLIVISAAAAIRQMVFDFRTHRASEETIRAANAQLRTQTGILNAVLQSISDGVIVADDGGRFIIWNPAAARIMGRGPEPVPVDEWSKTYGVFLSDGQTVHPADQLPLARAMRGESVDNAILSIKRPDTGEIRWLRVGARPLRDGADAIIGGTVIVSDVTDQWKADELLQQNNDLLERRVVQRTLDLTRSNQELEQFAYVASHDLQQPLRMVTSYVQLLEKHYKDKLDPEALEYIAFAVDGTLRMKRLINDLLAYSRVGRVNERRTKVNLAEVVSNARKNLEVNIRDRQTLIIQGDLPVVWGDEGELTQLFQNILDNAVKYHADRTPEIRIQAERREADWLFSIRDNGIGIDPQYADRILLIFQRLHGKERFPGTGIGLAICKKVVEHHGGRIWFESKIGEGTTFYFTIPDAETSDDVHNPGQADRNLVGGGRSR